MAVLKFDKKNFRSHSLENKEIIKTSLEECGAGRSILVDNEENIIAGNGVYKEAKNQNIPIRIIETDGSELIVVKRKDISPEDKKREKLAFYDNLAGDNVTWDHSKLEQSQAITAELLETYNIKKGESFQRIFQEEAEEQPEQVDFPITIIANEDQFNQFLQLQEQFNTNTQMKTFEQILKTAYDFTFRR